MAEGGGQPKPGGSNYYTNVVECRHHPGAPLIEDHSAGDMICQECGLVVGDRSVSLFSVLFRCMCGHKARGAYYKFAHGGARAGR